MEETMKIKWMVLCAILASGLFAESTLKRARNISSSEEGTLFLEEWDSGRIHSEDGLPLGIALHQLSQWEPELYGERALGILEGIDKAEALAYHGSTLTLLASLEEKDSPLKALKYLDKGSKEIDRAVTMEPENLNLRILRLCNAVEVSLSSPMDRFETASADREMILDWLDKAEDLKPEECASYWYYLGELELGLSRWDQALDCFYRVCEEAPLSLWAERAEDQLFLLEE